MVERPVSKFSRDLSDVLQGFMRERDITGKAVARHLGRSEGFISERTSGKRPPDTDILDAVADLASIHTSALMLELARRMAEVPSDVRADADEIRRAMHKGRLPSPADRPIADEDDAG